ncbi:tetratricopeptide repeat protein, partial [Marinomonas sp.]
NLGSAYESLGDYPKAIEYLELALASDLKTYGEDHPSVATRRNNLGSAYDSLGDYPKAIEYYDSAYLIMLNVLGDSHPNTKIVKENLDRAIRESTKQ